MSILLILTSCSSKNTVSNTVKPGNSPTSSKTGSTSSVTEGVYGVGYDESKEIDALNTLFDTSHSLQIVKKGGTQYNASSVLTDVIADLLAKAVEVKPDSPAGAKLINGYDFKKYDYKLIFNGAKPLLISIKDNLVHFDGQNTLYELWGDSSKLWENIKYDSKLDKYDLSSSSGLETMVKHYKNDITGNGRMTDINLVYKSSNNSDFKGELLLRIGTSEVSVYKDFSWQLRPEPTINEPPQIKFLSQKGTSNKIIIVYFSRLTGGYSQTGEINTYCYKSGKIQDIDF
ncbi:MAG: hypothetical protein Q8903_14890, partial [Bacteroidota bacterium]|nr:hypothetical protein [Bacteroidota bacterium]